MTIGNIKNPQWGDANRSGIIVNLDIDGETVTFVARQNDCTDYGPKIYQDCIDGKYGDISEFSIPEKTREQLEAIADSELELKLQSIMTTENRALAEVDDEYRTEYKAKIKELLAVKKQKGWPESIEWPGNNKMQLR